MDSVRLNRGCINHVTSFPHTEENRLQYKETQTIPPRERELHAYLGWLVNNLFITSNSDASSLRICVGRCFGGE
jgi:hypothetical protein